MRAGRDVCDCITDVIVENVLIDLLMIECREAANRFIPTNDTFL